MKNVTVVLSGVGTAGFSTITLMEFFHQHGIVPNTIVGCSSAAFVAGLWAKGYSPKEALALVREVYLTLMKPRIDHYTSFFFFKAPKKNFDINRALLKADIKEEYRRIFNKEVIEDLSIKTYFHTTNIETGDPYLIKHGSIAQAIYASSAILPFYPPVHLHNKWLAAGLFSETLPLRALLDESSDIIIATDINNEAEHKKENFLSFYTNFVDKAFKVSSMPYTALVYDLHSNEILIIPIKIEHQEFKDPLLALEYSIEFARRNVQEKAQIILDTLK
ncbi:MAG: patatin-like phospholipase family protein [Proteobacteria bacterium]|nr:patatin-like phospholipase family protein [Pseudomonadota bacterium]